MSDKTETRPATKAVWVDFKDLRFVTSYNMIVRNEPKEKPPLTTAFLDLDKTAVVFGQDTEQTAKRKVELLNLLAEKYNTRIVVLTQNPAGLFVGPTADPMYKEFTNLAWPNGETPFLVCETGAVVVKRGQIIVDEQFTPFRYDQRPTIVDFANKKLVGKAKVRKEDVVSVALIPEEPFVKKTGSEGEAKVAIYSELQNGLPEEVMQSVNIFLDGRNVDLLPFLLALNRKKSALKTAAMQLHGAIGEQTRSLIKSSILIDDGALAAEKAMNTVHTLGGRMATPHNADLALKDVIRRFGGHIAENDLFDGVIEALIEHKTDPAILQMLSEI